LSCGAPALRAGRFWKEYDVILKGFLDFYRSNAPMLPGLYFPELVEEKLLFNSDFLKTAKMVRDRCIHRAKYANPIRWQPAFRQLIYRNEESRLIVAITQNSIGNAITELVGVVVSRAPGAAAYTRAEPALLEQLFEVGRGPLL